MNTALWSLPGLGGRLLQRNQKIRKEETEDQIQGVTS
jgi:hypothetical protein